MRESAIQNQQKKMLLANERIQIVLTESLNKTNKLISKNLQIQSAHICMP